YCYSELFAQFLINFNECLSLMSLILLIIGIDKKFFFGQTLAIVSKRLK
ncbi:MAG: hypothetical protein QG588_850, partial [Candidatus Poribacteria bacterium]|nr:hypothetical protein [Candidatus Poribacteria bacterium]